MPGTRPTYSHDQREALIRRVLVDGISARRAAKEANAGELPSAGGAMEAFGVTEDTAREWVRDRRAEVDAQTPPTPAEYVEIGNRLWGVHVREVERLERLQRSRKRTESEREKRDDALDRRLTSAVKRHKEARALLATPNPDPEEGDQAGEKLPAKPQGFVDQLAATAARTTTPTPQPQGAREKEGHEVGSDAGSDVRSSNGGGGAVLAAARAFEQRSGEHLNEASTDPDQ